MKARLDPALFRRFEFRLEMPALSRAQRTALYCKCALGWRPGEGEQPVIDAVVARRLDALTCTFDYDESVGQVELCRSIVPATSSR